MEEQWKSFYLLGTGYEMYSEQLSPTFTGMTFGEAAEKEMCFKSKVIKEVHRLASVCKNGRTILKRQHK